MRDLRVLTLVLAHIALSCGCDDKACEPETEVECTCEDGSEGTQYCLSNRKLDDCYCGLSEPWGDDSDDEPGRFDAGSGDIDDPTWPPFDANSIFDPLLRDGGLDAAPPSDGVMLSAGTGRLIDVFARNNDVWVVVPDRVVRISLQDGRELAHWDAPRPLTAAAFDGERLAALDAARVTFLDRLGLTAQRSLNLIEPCISASLVVGAPLVCDPDAYGGTLYTIDPVTGAQQSVTSLGRGGKVIAVPGTPRFLRMDTTASSLTPSVFELATDGGTLQLLDAGPYQPNSPLWSAPVGFDTVPAKNLVNRQGVLVRMDSTCAGSAEPCFQRSGTLGLVQQQEAFLALTTVGDALFGLLDPSNSTAISGPRCSAQPCRLMNIDVAARAIRVEQSVRRPLRSVIAMQMLPEQSTAVLGVGAVGSERYSSFSDAGYEVVRLSVKGKE